MEQWPVIRYRLARTLALAAIAVAAARTNAAAQQVVLISLPASVGFAVTDVGQPTIGGPDPTTVSFTIVNLALFHVLRVSVKADADFVPPGGAAIPASRVSWTTSNASQATGRNGTMSTAAFTEVFETGSGVVGAGGIDVHWTLATPGASIRAGTHVATIRWRLESVVP
jgi:hypothetical protein